MSTVEKEVSQSDSVRKHKEFLFPAVAMYYKEPLALVRGEGFHVWDDQNNKYLDCFGGVLTVSVGHNNPRVSEAIIKQIQSIHGANPHITHTVAAQCLNNIITKCMWIFLFPFISCISTCLAI